MLQMNVILIILQGIISVIECWFGLIKHRRWHRNHHRRHHHHEFYGE